MDMTYGSDVAIGALDRLGIDHVAFNPGASFRGLHESMVHAGVQRHVLCLSEGVAVAVGHGFAKATGRPMAVFLHNLVGLQSGSMALFNAWIDQVPMLVVGGSGPADRTERRPWIDWIHAAKPQGSAVRDWVKWDDEPTSIPAMLSSLSRAYRLATAPPEGPVYVALDALLQENEAPPVDLSVLEATPPSRITAPTADLEELADALLSADRPVVVTDTTGRSRLAYDALVSLSELLKISVIDIGGRHSFPNTHPGDGTQLRSQLLADADLVLLLDVRDPGWALCDVNPADRSARSLVTEDCRVVSVGLSALMTRGFLEPQGELRPGDEELVADTAVALPELVAMIEADRRCEVAAARRADGYATGHARQEEGLAGSGPIDDDDLAAAAYRAVREGPWQLAYGSLRGAVRRQWELDHWNAHLGGSGGAGLGYGVGAAIGAALGDEEDRLIVSLQADGDLLYTASGLWTAAHERLPLLMVVVNNRSYGQDRMHQTIMARQRSRPEAHAAVGIDLDDPEIDFAGLARAQGVEAFGRITDAEELDETLQRAARIVRDEHRPVVVDVQVDR